MYEQAEPWVIVVTHLAEQRSAEFALVLTARGIEHQRRASSSGWQLSVPADRADQAVAELSAYYRENNRRATGSRAVKHIGSGWPGVAAYAATLLTVFVCLRSDLFGFDWLGAGRLEAGGVVAGEWWRTVTALTVHLDVDHLGSNLAFGGFFGYFIGRYLGTGLGWIAILAGGALGNLLNAIVQSAEHRSIGASTAVFAALGLLTAYTWRRGFLRDTPWRARIAPIVAGIALLAYTGTGGENTDIFAHLTGFVAGFGFGLVLARWSVPRTPRWQVGYAATAVALIVTAWVWGLMLEG